MNKLKFKTLDVTQLTDEIYRIRLSPLVDEVFSFKGGQYLFLHLSDGKKIPLSIASAPEEKDFIELHIRKMGTPSLAAEMISLFESAHEIEIEAPFGNCVLPEGDAPVVIIAGGTGFSPVKSIIESALQSDGSREIALYLGAQKAADIYQTDIIQSWPTQAHDFKYTPVISEGEAEWNGATGFPHEIAINDHKHRLEDCEFVICGSEAMVMNVYQSLTVSGVPSKQIHSDILDIKRESGLL